MKKIPKKIANEVNAMFKRLGNGVQFDIFDLGKIAEAAENVLLAKGPIEDAEAAMIAAIAAYRKN